MKISNEKKQEIRDKLFEYDLSVSESKLLEEEVFNILDQELSNHTQRVREELEAWSPTHYKGYGVSPLHMTLDDHKRNFVRELLQLPSLNPTKDNEKES